MIKQIKNYKIIKLIGKGTFGEVYKVSKDNKYYALKIYQIKNDDTSSSNEYKESIKSIENEIKILSQLDNPFIVKLYEVFSLNPNSELLKNNDIEEQQMMCLVLELCENGDLNDKIKEKKQKNEIFSENEILQYFYEILQGLYYLHKNRVIHRDLKTLNIFLTENNHIKIGDFGVSKKLINNNIYAYTFVGTPYYLSPEICQNKPYDEKSDVWSLGVVLYELITLNKPFDSESQMGLFMKILKGKPAPINNTIKHSYSQKLINLVLENLLDKDPLTRYSIQQTINSGIFNKFFREKEIKYKLSKKRKEQKHSINNTINNNNYQINQSKKNTNRNKALTNQNNNLIKSNVITDSKRIRTNPLKGNIKSNTLSRRAQIAKIPGQNQEKKISLHEKHLQINNKYLNTYKEKISKGEPRITASKYLHQILLNDDEENLNNDLQNNHQEIGKNKNIQNNSTINTIFNNANFNFDDELKNESNIINNNINNNDSNNINDENKEKNKIIYKPQFMMMNANIPEISSSELNNNNSEEISNNRYIELDESNTHSILTELLQDPDYTEDSKEENEEIPIIENFEDVANDRIEIKEIKNKEKTLEELQSEANDKFGKEIVDEILNKYDEYQNDMNFDQTKELDELIFKKMKEDKKKYIDFLEIFYKIIYIKCAQQVENTK
jgi:NIMA (never in mitosis gene a)-related kinase